MKKLKIITILLIIAVLITIGIIYYFNENPKLEPGQFKYGWNEEKFIGYYKNYENYSKALNYLKEQTHENSIILSWWDEGHMIRAFGKRNAIIYNPSKEMLENNPLMKFSKNRGELEEDNTIRDIALFLISNNTIDSKNHIKKYNSTYVFLTIYEYRIASTINHYSGREYFTQGINPQRMCFREIGKKDCYRGEDCADALTSEERTHHIFQCQFHDDSLAYKMLKLQEVPGFEKVYSDEFAVIYKWT